MFKPKPSTLAQLKHSLSQWQDPYLGTDLMTAQAVTDIQLNQGQAIIAISLGYPTLGLADKTSDWHTSLRQHVLKVADIEQVTLELSWDRSSYQPQGELTPLPGVANIIPIASAKGGVGKSTVTTNLALALASQGARVGIMDGDIYGPSQGLALGVAPNTRPEIAEQKYFKPIVAHGLQFISMSLVAEQGTAMIWRGPMASKALQQLLGQTLWSDLDYLLVDMPPGTGDIQLTLAQKIPIAGALIVTTPQDLALLDVEKAIQLFDKVSVPIVGLVENMAFYRCPDCGHQAAIFGSGGGEQLASKQQIDYLGAIPLDTRIREHMDQGLATVLAEPQSEITQLYQELARKLAGRLSLRPKASGHSQGIKLRNL